MQLDKGTFKKMFPHLAEEMTEEKSREDINSARSGPANGKRVITSKCFDDYNPTVIDFLCRCDNAKQAEEIIDYLEKRGEIDCNYSQNLRTQLKRKGIRSFGTKREEDYYLRESGH